MSTIAPTPKPAGSRAPSAAPVAPPPQRMSVASMAIWVLISLLGAGCLAYVGFARGETLSAAWLVTAALCTYAVGFRFYSKFIAAKIFALAPQLTPAQVAELILRGTDTLDTESKLPLIHPARSLEFARTAAAG